MTLAVFQSSGTFFNHYDLSKIIDCGLTMTLASSLSTYGCTPSLLTLLSPLQTFPLISRTWDFQKADLARKDHHVEGIEYLSLICVDCHYRARSAGPHCPQSSLNCWYACAFYIAFCVPRWVQLQMGFDVSNSITTHLDSVSVLPRPLVLAISFFLLIDEFCQEFPVHLCRSPFYTLGETHLELDSWTKNQTAAPFFFPELYSMWLLQAGPWGNQKYSFLECRVLLFALSPPFLILSSTAHDCPQPSHSLY